MRIGIASVRPERIEAIRAALEPAREHAIVWTAGSAAQAVRLAGAGDSGPSRGERPEVILVDVELPEGGARATQLLVDSVPCLVLVFAERLAAKASAIYAALGQGALDAVEIPVLRADGTLDNPAPLLEKIATLGWLTPGAAPESKGAVAPTAARAPLILIGSSTGGPRVLAEILAALPAGFPAAIVVVQHVDRYFAQGLADWLARQSPLPVQLARAGVAPVSGQVLLADTNDHLIVTADQTLGYTSEPIDEPYRPSVNVLFLSARQHWSRPGIAVLLTGMGKDGAMGLKELRRAGWHTIAQDQDSSAVYGMPKAAATCGAAVEILPSDQIASALKSRVAIR